MPLPYQIEQWDAANGTAAIWLKVPTIAGNARQEIKMYWGKADAVSESSGPTVFNAANGYFSVFHMNETVKDEVGTLTPTNTGTTAGHRHDRQRPEFHRGQGHQLRGEHHRTIRPATTPTPPRPGSGPQCGKPTLLTGAPKQGQRQSARCKLASPPNDLWIDGSTAPVSLAPARCPSANGIMWRTPIRAGAAKIYVNGQLDGIGTAAPMNSGDSRQDVDWRLV